MNEIITKSRFTWEQSLFDDFDGGELDAKIWRRCPEQRRQDAGGWWRDSESFLDGKGNLVLQNRIDSDGTPVSGAIRSRGLFEQAYGIYECRFKVPDATGFWCAFWLMGDTVSRVGGGSAEGVEIDIFESVAADRLMSFNMHWDGYGADHKHVGTSMKVDGSFYNNWHTSALEWNEDEYIFYLDGAEVWRTTADGICHVPEFIKFSCEFGKWGGAQTPASYPSAMLVDWVRVWKMTGRKK